VDERLKDRLAFLGSLSSGLAHEIKNPLSTMTITLGLLREDFEGSESPRDRRTLRKIQLLESEVARLEHILHDFLQFAGGHTVRPELVAVNEWLCELLDFFEPSCVESRVRLVRKLGPDLPQVLVDRELMKQALFNLLRNALQAMAGGGTLTVKTWSAGDRVRLDVSDTGEGIAPDLLARIWEVYFTTKEQGTGLGLPTVRRIVAEHGGEVSVQSRRGRGTTFTIFLPVPPTIGGGEELRLPGRESDAEDGVGEDLSRLFSPSMRARGSGA
jgi:signal transduction histidine kinase